MSDAPEELRAALADRYGLGAEIGAGGMARVYEAVDLKHGRTVALKVLRPEVAADTGTARFLREIRTAARVNDPHILPLHDSGEAAGFTYFVMPLVTGPSLKDRLRADGALAPGEAARVVQAVAAALDAAHAAGVVHRDIKPANVLSYGGTWVVADFGIARTAEFMDEEDLTRATELLGTPRYMSPEQISGGGAVGPRSDQYSLACMAYEILGGSPPFDASTPIALATQHLSRPVPPVRTHRPDLPAAVEGVLERALAKNAGERYPSAGAFADALTDALGVTSGGERHEMVAPGSPGGRRWGVWILGTGVVAVAGWIGFRGLPAGPDAVSDEDPVVAVLPFDHIGPAGDAYFTDGLTDEITTRLAGLSGMEVIPRASTAHYDRQEQSLQAIAAELGATHLLLGSIRSDRRPDGTGLVRVVPILIRARDARELWTEPLDADLVPGEIFRMQSEIAQEVAASLNMTLLPLERRPVEARPTESLEAFDLYLRGNRYASQYLEPSELREAIRMYERTVEVDPDFAQAHARLAQVQSQFYYFFDRSPDRLQAAADALERAMDLAPEIRETWIARGYVDYWGHLRYEEALEAFRAAGSATTTDPDLLWVVASAQRRQGRYLEAMETLRRAAEVSPRTPLVWFELAATLVMLRRYDEALEASERAVALAPDWISGELVAVFVLAYSHGPEAALARLNEAARTPERRREVMGQLVGEFLRRVWWGAVLDEPWQEALHRFALQDATVDSALYYTAKAHLYSRWGQEERTRAYYDSTRVVLEGRLRTNPDPNLRVDLAQAYAGTGREDEALAEVRRVLAADLVTRDAFRGPWYEMELVRVLVMLDRKAEAMDLLEELFLIPSPASPELLRIDPRLEPLETEPRFREWVAGDTPGPGS